MFTKLTKICQSKLSLIHSPPLTEVRVRFDCQIPDNGILPSRRIVSICSNSRSLSFRSTPFLLSAYQCSQYNPLSHITGTWLTRLDRLAPSSVKIVDFAPRYQIRKPPPFYRFRWSALDQTRRHGYGNSTTLFLTPQNKLWITSLCSSWDHRSNLLSSPFFSQLKLTMKRMNRAYRTMVDWQMFGQVEFVCSRWLRDVYLLITNIFLLCWEWSNWESMSGTRWYRGGRKRLWRGAWGGMLKRDSRWVGARNLLVFHSRWLTMLWSLSHSWRRLQYILTSRPSQGLPRFDSLRRKGQPRRRKISSISKTWIWRSWRVWE